MQQIEKTDSVAIVFSALYVGGAEKLGVSLANKFISSGRATYIILFEKFDCPYLSQIDERVEIIYIPRKSKFNIVLNKQFDEIIHQKNINKVVFFCLSPVFLSRIFSFKRNSAVSYFVTLHSTIPVNLKSYLKTQLFLRFIRKTDKVVFVCQNQRLYDQRKFLFSPPLYEVIYNGVDINYFKPGNMFQAENRKEAMQIPATDKVILLVATLRLEKGHAYAIKALHILHSKYPGKKDTHLVFAGGGAASYIAKLKQLVKFYSLEKFVHFEGYQDDVRPYYEIADVFTLTSGSIETFSIAALEAMCYGLPISLTNIGGASEMIEEGKNGLLSKAKDARSIAHSWAALLDTAFDKKAIRELVVNNYALDPVFEKYVKTINGHPAKNKT